MIEPREPTPTIVDIESVRETVDTLTRVLATIDATKDSLDDINRAERNDIRRYIEKTLADIITNLDGSDYQLAFTVGAKALQTLFYNKIHGPSWVPSIDEVSGRMVQPGETWGFDGTSELVNLPAEVQQWKIFGNSEGAVDLNTIAAAVSQGGALKVIERKQPIDEEARQREIEELKRSIDSMIADLKNWREFITSDSIQRRELAKPLFQRSCETLETLLGRSEELGQRLTLTATDQAIDTISFTKDTYDFLTPYYKGPIEPGESIVLRYLQKIINTEQTATFFYVGEIRRKVEVGELAKALADGAQINLVPAE